MLLSSTINFVFDYYSSIQKDIFLFNLFLQIKGDSPEMVELIGMKNLLNAVKGSVGLRNGKVIFGVEGMLIVMLIGQRSILLLILCSPIRNKFSTQLSVYCPLICKCFIRWQV